MREPSVMCPACYGNGRAYHPSGCAKCDGYGSLKASREYGPNWRAELAKQPVPTWPYAEGWGPSGELPLVAPPQEGA
jgi:hypothetical protein